MRTASFRDDVLWAIAYKLGYDPLRHGLLKNQAEALSNFINAWVRRTWDNFDRPEWTTIEKRAVTNYYVAYDQPGFQTISRPLKVYLVDPQQIQGPTDTHFDLLDQGLHVGWDTGGSVWIKFVPMAPKFTATAWDSAIAYAKNQLSYSPITGECYSSRSGGNVGHDPSFSLESPLTIVPVQEASPARVAIPPTNQKWGVIVTPPPWYSVAGTTYTIRFVTPVGGGPGTHTWSYTTSSGGGTVDNLLDGLIAAAAASSDPWVQALTLSKNTGKSQLVVEKGEVFADAGSTVTNGTILGPGTTTLTAVLLQAYYAGMPATAGQPQITNVVLPNPLALGAVYTIDITDYTGTVHSFSYDSDPTQGPNAVLDGLYAAFIALQATDSWLNSRVAVAEDYSNGQLVISIGETASVNGELDQDSSPWWNHVLFPLALVEGVVAGAYADALKEAGQTDKGNAEQQGAVAEDAAATQKQIAPPYTTLTDQEKPVNRYNAGG